MSRYVSTERMRPVLKQCAHIQSQSSDNISVCAIKVRATTATAADCLERYEALKKENEALKKSLQDVAELKGEILLNVMCALNIYCKDCLSALAKKSEENFYRSIAARRESEHLVRYNIALQAALVGAWKSKYADCAKYISCPSPSKTSAKHSLIEDVLLHSSDKTVNVSSIASSTETQCIVSTNPPPLSAKVLSSSPPVKPYICSLDSPFAQNILKLSSKFQPAESPHSSGRLFTTDVHQKQAIKENEILSPNTNYTADCVTCIDIAELQSGPHTHDYVSCYPSNTISECELKLRNELHAQNEAEYHNIEKIPKLHIDSSPVNSCSSSNSQRIPCMQQSMVDILAREQRKRHQNFQNLISSTSSDPDIKNQTSSKQLSPFTSASSNSTGNIIEIFWEFEFNTKSNYFKSDPFTFGGSMWRLTFQKNLSTGSCVSYGLMISHISREYDTKRVIIQCEFRLHCEKRPPYAPKLNVGSCKSSRNRLYTFSATTPSSSGFQHFIGPEIMEYVKNGKLTMSAVVNLMDFKQ